MRGIVLTCTIVESNFSRLCLVAEIVSMILYYL